MPVKGRVLVVEDSPTQAEVLVSTLEHAGFAPTLADCGEDALEIVGRENFDIVVSDVMMPGISGYELCRQVKSQFSPEIPVVLLTSLTDPMAIIRGLECGADNYVTKPYAPAHLVARIRHALDKYSLRPVRRASMGVNVSFLGSTFVINSEREQILDLFLSSIEDVVRTNEALVASQRQLAEAQRQLQAFASRMELEAIVNAEKYATLMQSAADAILVVDSDGRIEEANRRAVAVLGADTAELRGRSLAEFVHSDARALLEHQLSSSAEAPGRAVDIEFGSGSRKAFFDLTVSRTGTGGTESALVILHDVTERREAEARIRQSEQQLATAQRVAGFGSLEWTIPTGEIAWSQQTAAIYGRSPHFIPTHEVISAQVHPDDADKRAKSIALALAGKGGTESEYRIVRPDGAIRQVQVRREVLRDDAGKPMRMISTVLDVTDRRSLEEQLRQSQKMEAIGQLAGGIAHDFNNLITVIVSYSEMAMSTLPDDSPLRDDIAQIRRAGESAAALTRQLLAFSRKQVIKPQPLSLAECVSGLGRMLERLLGENIKLTVDPDREAGLVMADPHQIEQVVMNLAVNARDAMPQGGSLDIRTRRMQVGDGAKKIHPALESGTYEVLTVTDTGGGMDAETKTRIFEPFFTTKPQGQGTGLGLSTVYGIVKQSGGEVTVESEPGRGTAFTVILPALSEDAFQESLVGAESKGSVSQKSRPDTMTVLVAEDEISVRNLLSRILAREGYHVLEAPNGAAAVALAEKFDKPIHLIISDVVMPETSGPTMVEAICAVRKDVKVIFISGYTHDDILRSGLADPNVVFLPKPFVPRQVIDAVKQVLG